MPTWAWILVAYHAAAALVLLIDGQYPDDPYHPDERTWWMRLLQAELWGPLLLWVFWDELRRSEGRRG